ncbi:hypothetical protein [Dysgonomonas sp. 520]|uniref:hypothetical protein n=1 Tax=Dysgonomonas sp. 520 TaxID=2302931 RepID=UPI0013D6571F|nr:hypothetical protein [Dysgonomonas sp. 520]NDW10066.1 hypothetical protein [Dysgonomonas sp. 520]
MAKCQINSSITKSCDYNLSGIARLYLTNFNEKSTYTTDADGYITDITLEATDKYFKFDFNNETAFFQDDLVVSNGNKYRQITVQAVISNNDIEMLNQVTPLDLGKFTAVLVDKSGKCNLVGRINGIEATANNYNSGSAVGDAQGWTITMVGVEPEVHTLLLDETVVSGLV